VRATLGSSANRAQSNASQIIAPFAAVMFGQLATVLFPSMLTSRYTPMGGYERSMYVTKLTHAAERVVHCSKINSSVMMKRREDRGGAIPVSSAV
jgi:hypothetical protein